MKKTILLLTMLLATSSAFSEQFSLISIDYDTHKNIDKVICIYEGGYSTIRSASTGCLKRIQRL